MRNKSSEARLLLRRGHGGAHLRPTRLLKVATHRAPATGAEYRKWDTSCFR